MTDRTPTDGWGPRSEVSSGRPDRVPCSTRSYFHDYEGPASWRIPPEGEDASSIPEALLDLYPPDDPYSRGTRIAGKYQLLRRLEAGGMGVLWVAHNIPLDIQVALKFVRGGEGSPRLLREARAAARVDHPAIVRVFDLGETDAGEPFIVMELLDGESLASRLRREGRLDAITAVRALLPIAEALSVLHDKRIVHRDVKPDNIFLARQDAGRFQPKLVDFGIARLEGGRLTQRGTVLGSPSYLSPEQARGLDVDHRSDVWALCVVLYEVITGSRPFAGASPRKLFEAIFEREPSPITSFAVGDGALWAILARGLRKSPDQRWPSTRELGEALAGWLVTHGVHDDVCGASLASSWLGAEATAQPRVAPRRRASGDGPSRAPQFADRLRPARSDARPRVARSRLMSAVAVGALLLAGTATWRLVTIAKASATAGAQPSASSPAPDPEQATAPEPVEDAPPQIDAAPRSAIEPSTPAAVRSAAAPTGRARPPATLKRGTAAPLKDPFADPLKVPSWKR